MDRLEFSHSCTYCPINSNALLLKHRRNGSDHNDIGDGANEHIFCHAAPDVAIGLGRRIPNGI